MKITGLDILSPFYRPLADALFYSAFRASYRIIGKENFRGHVLIVGCGDSALLRYLNLSNVPHLTLLDISKGMIAQTKKSKHYKPHKMSCVEIDFLQYTHDNKFDIVIMPFYLDMFSSKEQSRHLNKAISLVKEDGAIYVTDFIYSNKFWRSLKINVSRVFFSILTLRLIPPIHIVEEVIDSGIPNGSYTLSKENGVGVWYIKPFATASKLQNSVLS